MNERLEFETSKISPLLAVMYVPCRFSVKRERDGKIRAVPFGEYAGFMNEADAKAFLKKIEDAFKKKGIVNFEDIKKCSILSRDAVNLAKTVKGKGASFLLPAFKAPDLQRLDAVSLQDLSKVSWYATLGRKGNDIGCLKVKTEKDKNDDGMVWFDLPGTTLRIKASLTLLKEFEQAYGKKIDFSLGKSKGITHTVENVHRRTNAKD
jgi:hypothetical protein